MIYNINLGKEVRRIDKIVIGIKESDDEMINLRIGFKKIGKILEGKIVVEKKDIKIVKEKNIVNLINNNRIGMLKGEERNGDIEREIMSLKGKELEKWGNSKMIGKIIKKKELESIKRKFEEMKKENINKMEKRKEKNEEKGSRFEIEIEGMEDKKKFLIGICRMYIVEGGFIIENIVRMEGVKIIIGNRKKILRFIRNL